MGVDVAAQVPPAIGPYQPLRLLGEGGMGKVYLARSPGSRLVALKVIRPEYADDPGFRDRFRREVEAARRVSGFFTTPVVDADADGPRPWLATSYVPAPALSEIVRRYGPLPEPALRALGAGLAEALAAVHAAGLIHRDLKPGNVLVAGDGPRVIDFGISRAMDGTRVTRTGGMVGTPGFMSPEQIAGGGDIGPSSDVFALGCVLVYAATGRNPFGTGDAANLLYRVVYEEPNLDGVPAGLVPLVEDCLDKDPARRPAVRALLDALSPADPAALLTPALRDDLAERGEEAASIASRPMTAPPIVPPTVPPGLPGLPAPPGPAGAPGRAPGAPSRRAFLALAGGGVAAVAAAGGGALMLGAFGDEKSPVRRENVSAGPFAGDAVPAAPAPAWTLNAPRPLERGALAMMGGTLVWWEGDGETALGVDPATGRQRWSAKPSLPADEASARIRWAGVYGPTLFGVAGFDLIFGIDQDGRQRFLHHAPEDGGEQVYVHGLRDAGGGIMLLEAEALTVAVEISSGRKLWRNKTRFANMNGALTDGRRVYVQDTSTTKALDLRSGRVLWTAPGTGRDGVNGHLSLTGGVLTVTTTRVVGLDAATGRRRWTAVQQSTTLARTTADGGQVFVKDGNDRVWALNARDGKTLWATKSPLPLQASDVDSAQPPSIAVSGRLVAVPLYEPNGGFAVFRRSDGTILWAHKVPGGSPLNSWSLAISGTTVYAASQSALHAFEGKA